MRLPPISSPNTSAARNTKPSCITSDMGHTNRPAATLTPLQLAVLRSLEVRDGVACKADLLSSLEATTRYTRESGSYAVRELLALGLLWCEGALLGLSSEACQLVAF